MFYIKKYIDGIAIHNDDTGDSKLLTDQEIKIALERHPSLKEEKTVAVYFDDPCNEILNGGLKVKEDFDVRNKRI